MRDYPITAAAAASFWDRVRIGGPDDCWLWTGACNHHGGHGQVSLDSRVYSTHRAAWELTNGPIPDGLWVLHRCPTQDAPSCCNPAHLYLGTRADNVRDSVKSGAMKRGSHKMLVTRRERNPYPMGEHHHNAKLTTADVLDIRATYRKNGVRLRHLAEKYHVSIKTISKVVRREDWAHLP